ncbi:MAG: TPM domain-containing protein [Faecalibacillus sp.]
MKKILLTFISFVLFTMMLIIPSYAQETRCYDGAHLLSIENQEKLNNQLNSLSHKYDFDVFIVTIDSLEGQSSREYADRFFDEKKYGMGQGEDGILLLIAMENRDWAISTCGFGITAFTDAGQEYMVEQFKPLLSEGQYYEAFNEFAHLCDDFIQHAKNGEPYDRSSLPKKAIQLYWIFIAIAIGCLIALLIMLGLKAQLKTVRHQPYASDYVHHLKINRHQDIYLYRNVTRRKKPEKTSGGSSVHRSSSGSYHGGSSGHF